MSKTKWFIFICLLVSLFTVLNAEKRAVQKSMKELTDPSSPSFVPYPYPNNRKEIIADLKFAIKRIYPNQTSGYNSILPQSKNVTKRIKLNLLESQSKYKIDKILKVRQQQSGFAMDYYWVIYILNKKDNSIAARIFMLAEGLLGGTAAYSPGQEPFYIITDQDIINYMDEYTELNGLKKNVQNIDRVFYPSPLASLQIPFWEIKMKSGQIFYYSFLTDAFYRIKEEIPWKKDKSGRRPNFQNLITQSDFAFDEVEDKIFIYEKLKKKE